MNAVITLGIDMSSQPKGTAACAVTWEADRAVTVTPCLGCDDEMLSEMIAKSDAVGIDAPFGWPAEFAVAVGAWSFTFWTPQLRERLCFREDRSSCARNRGTLAAERLCGSDRAAGDAYIRAVGPPWSYGSQRRQQVLRGLSSRQFEPVGADEQRLQEEQTRSQRSARNHLGGLREKMPWLVLPDACATTGVGQTSGQSKSRRALRFWRRGRRGGLFSSHSPQQSIIRSPLAALCNYYAGAVESFDQAPPSHPAGRGKPLA